MGQYLKRKGDGTFFAVSSPFFSVYSLNGSGSKGVPALHICEEFLRPVLIEMTWIVSLRSTCFFEWAEAPH